MDIEVVHEPTRGRFFTRAADQESQLVYALVHPGVVDFRSTYVHPAVRGRGVGEKLVREAFEWARAEGLKVIPTCWFVDAVVRRHPEYEALLQP